MADNTVLNVGTGGDTVRDVDKGGIKTPVVMVDIGGIGTESLFDGSVKGLVADAVQAYVDGSSQMLSLTNDGRLRVSVMPARSEVQFFSKEQEDAWGDLQGDITFSGSPWDVW